MATVDREAKQKAALSALERGSHYEVEEATERSFGIVFAFVFGLVGAYWLIVYEEKLFWLFAVSLVFLFLGLVQPRLLAPLNHLWIKLGYLLGSVVAPIVMLLVFVTTVIPTALIMRVLKKDILFLRKPGPEVTTFWQQRNHEMDSETSMNNQF